ncbi:alanine acetyltransferase [Thalassobacillus devorans]|uniref:Alanine acetyltransferase n=1 Tax=Thalassobacillus devorans TaxID=279813 RepID=A0ABQ1PS44_9BACI|nr:GNAT family N-acetyltransferase [Thalassobacillus devorans]NIK30523.1 RimJ/RimL family protein N-acetyltransferase [Thalassobacillus devorans]GGD02263.1 alanine acetyltransferase [Thalassobacillus devorans]
MLKKRDLHDAPVLFELMSHPEVFPYVRHKAYSSDEFYFLTRHTIEAEENGELISRTIVDEWNQPIGTINLFDITDNKGFLATWIGQPYFGKGYNRPAKEAFFEELFFQLDIEAIFMKIRRNNPRSMKAALKLPYVTHANADYPEIYRRINEKEDVYDLFAITKEQYLFHYYSGGESEEVLEA